MQKSKPIGLYVHVPFCAKKCPYCDFYSLPYQKKAAEEWADAVQHEMAQYQKEALIADTLYFGGGTPSLPPPHLLAEIIETAKRIFSLNGEITLEANPNTLSFERLSFYRKAGFNRISIGMQSGNQTELSALGRSHTAKDAEKAVILAKDAGFSEISLDLMLGTPYQRKEKLQETLENVTSLPITHLSAYILKIEENTPFVNSPLLLEMPSEEQQAEFYLYAVQQLEQFGFYQYEISNFAKKGHESIHNLKYWKCEEYLGFGPAAHSFYKGIRFYNSENLLGYLESPASQKNIAEQKAGGAGEELMLALRLRDGIAFKRIEELCAKNQEEILCLLKPFFTHGLARLEQDRFILTPRGFLLSNSILTDIFEKLEIDFE